jgi:hypothetical protein
MECSSSMCSVSDDVSACNIVHKERTCICAPASAPVTPFPKNDPELDTDCLLALQSAMTRIYVYLP